MQYNNQAFEFVTSIHKKNDPSKIVEVANLLGLNPQLIYGALVEEADAQYHNSWWKNILDKGLDKETIDETEQQLQEDYQAVISSGIINDKTGLTGIFNTIMYPTMRDVGDGNIRVAVAIKEMEEALGKPIGTELGLQKYIGNYLGLVQDLYDPTGVKSDAGTADQRDTTAIVAIAALHLQRDKNWLLERVDQDYWNSLPPENQDAILITLYNNGLEAAEKSYQRQMDAYGFYRPTAGGGESGGLNHELNAEKINTELGIYGSDYGKHVSKLLEDYEFSELITLANNDDEFGSAIRYALKYNVPSIVVDRQNTPISLYEDTPLFSKESPDGMTSSYIQARVEMLTWKKAYDMADIDYDDRFNALGGLFPAPVDGDHIYHDLQTDLTLDIDGVNPTTFASHYHIFGSNEADTITGGNLEDVLFGGAGNDTIEAGKGSDYLEGNQGNDTLIGGSGNDRLIGGTGFDTYVIEDFDTIYDVDGQGTLQIEGIDNIPTLQLISANRWKSETEDATYFASKSGNDLFLTITAGSKTTRTTIQDFFASATTTDTSITALNISLQNSELISNEPQEGSLVTANPNLGSTIYTGTYQGAVNIVGSNKEDLVFTGDHAVTADLMAGNDMIFGSTAGDDINGNVGNDVLYGSGLYHETTAQIERPQADDDTLTGGLGIDLIAGGVGNDAIYGTERFSDSSQQSLAETGDWVLGGRGNDSIYGGQAQDFLQGGQDSDVISAGAGNDVILGDGNLRFGTQTFTKQGYYREAYVTYEPVYSYSPFIPPRYESVFHPAVFETIAFTYRYEENEWKNEKDNYHTYVHPDSFKWSISINSKTGDYAIDSIFEPREDHLVLVDSLESDNQTDYLFAGAGDDLVIGQYGDDFLWGEEGNDILWGDDNRDLTVQGNDWLDGGAGNDKLFGGKGNDTLVGSLGKDIMDGGDGYDTYTFSLTSLNDGETKTIIDSDGNGRIIINGEDWAGKTWTTVEEANGNPRWTDTQGNFVTQIGDSYLISSDNFASTIIIQDNSDEQPFGLQLTQPNEPPTVNEQMGDQVFIADEPFSLTLPSTLFTDPNGDELTYSIDNLPQWASFDAETNTLTGTPPAHTNIALKVTATDPSGAVSSQNFTLQSNSKPTVNQPLEAQQYIQTHQGDKTISLANIFADSDNQTLSYQITTTNGTLPTGISIDGQGQLHINTDTVTKGVYDLTIIATDTQGASVATTTQLNLIESLQTPQSGLNTGTLGDDVFVATGSTGLIINGLSGNDLLKGSAGNDTLNGGLDNDILVGNKGNDYLSGGFGNDTYIFNKGDGQDRIFDISGNDTIKFGDGITSHDIWMSKQGLDLQISLLGSNDKVTIEGWFIMPNQRIENIELTSGQKLSGDNLNSLIADMNTTNQTAMNDANFVNKVAQFWVV